MKQRKDSHIDKPLSIESLKDQGRKMNRRQLIKTSLLAGASTPFLERLGGGGDLLLAGSGGCQPICDTLQDLTGLPEANLIRQILDHMSQPMTLDDAQVRRLWNEGRRLAQEAINLQFPAPYTVRLDLDEETLDLQFDPILDYDDFLRREEALLCIDIDETAVSDSKAVAAVCNPFTLILKKLIVATGLDLYADVIVEINGALTVVFGDLIRSLIAALRAGQLRQAATILGQIIRTMIQINGPFYRELVRRLSLRFGQEGARRLARRIIRDILSKVSVGLGLALILINLGRAIARQIL